MIERFAIQVPAEDAVDKHGRKLTEAKLNAAKASGKLFAVADLKLTVLEVVKDEGFLYFLVDYDPKLQTKVAL